MRVPQLIRTCADVLRDGERCAEYQTGGHGHSTHAVSAAPTLSAGGYSRPLTILTGHDHIQAQRVVLGTSCGETGAGCTIGADYLDPREGPNTQALRDAQPVSPLHPAVGTSNTP